MPDDTARSVGQAHFDVQRRIFLHQYQEFLIRTSIPAKLRAEEAESTIAALRQITAMMLGPEATDAD